MTRIPSRPRAAGRTRVRTLRPRLELLEDRCLLANFLVTSTDDSGAGSLRQAILDANAAPGTDQIAFAIPGPGVHTISLASALPIIRDPVIIDGTTQPGFDPSNHRPVIELVGGADGLNEIGLDIPAGQSTVRGLVINRFYFGIRLRDHGGDRVEGNDIGTDVTGTVARANSFGIIIQDSDGDTIGGTTAGAGNLISGSTAGGLLISSSTNGVVQGNLIGTDASGTTALGKGADGISLVSSSDILIGGTMPAARNVIAAGVAFSTATRNVVQGNYIGIDATGTKSLGNQSNGVVLSGGANDNTIGGTASGAGNVISGNRGYGVAVSTTSGTATRNVVQGNLIGTDATGTVALGNLGGGVFTGSPDPDNTIGGTVAGARNVISGNGGATHTDGVFIGGPRTVVQGDFIGTDITGTKPLGNAGYGISMNASTNSHLLISGNVISANGTGGIRMNTGSGDRIEGNFIGTDATGTKALGNQGMGLRTEGPGFKDEMIGGTAAGAGNVISGNTGDGIYVGAAGTLIQGNRIGTDVTGTAPVPNGGNGVTIPGSGVTIGGLEAGAGNTIAFNGGAGVLVFQGTGNPILSNAIFSNGGLGIDLSGYNGDAVAHNDPGDADQGPNNRQNFPVLASAAGADRTTRVTGTLGSTPNRTYTIQFFASATGDPTGYGEGQTLLGTTTTTTGADGNATFDVTLATPLPAGQTVVTATATDPAGNTSEFSAGIQATLSLTATLSFSDLAASTTAGTDQTLTLTARDSSGLTATGYTGTVHFTSSDPDAVLPNDYTFTAADLGVHTFNVTFNTPGHQSLTATDKATASIAGSATIDVTGAALFEPQAAYSTGRRPYSVAVGDFNGDGIPDLVTPNFDSNTISVLLGKGDGTFQPAVDYGGGTNPVAVAVGDLNGDGRPDLAVSNWGDGTVSVLLARDDGTFAAAGTVNVGANPGSLAMGDFNGDNKIDLAVPTWIDGAVSVLLGQGDGTFQFPVIVNVGAEARAVAVGDFNGDGQLDFAAVKQVSGTVGVVLGNGDGTFQPAVDYKVGYRAPSIAAADLDHDGKLDLVTANYGTDSVSVLRGNGDGTFQPAVDYATGSNPGSVAVGDLDGDDNLDLAVADSGGHTVDVFLGRGDATFLAPQTYAVGAGPSSVAVGDFNRDGAPDLAVTNGDDNTVSILIHQHSAETLAVSGLPSSVTAGTIGTVTVTISDAQGHPDTRYAGTVHFTSSDPHAALPADYTFTAADQGVHSFSVTLTTAGSQSVTVTDTAAASLTDTRSGIQVSPASASTLRLDSSATTATAGAPYSLSVTALDPYGNTATGYAGTVKFTSSDGQAGLPSDYTFTAADHGSHTLSATFKTAGNQSLTITDTADASLTGTRSAISVIAAAAGALGIEGLSSSVNVGQAASFTVTARDPFGNVAPGYRGTVHFTSSDSQADLPSDYTFSAADQGTHTFSVTFKTGGAQTLTATDAVAPALTAAWSGHIVSTGQVAGLALTGLPPSVTSGHVTSFTVTALDSLGNTVTTYAGTIHFTSSDPQATLPPDYAFTSEDLGHHTFNVTLTSPGNQTITAADKAASTITGSASTMVQSATVGQFQVSAPASATAGGVFSIDVTAVDSAGDLLSGYAGTLHFSSTDPAAVLPGDYTFTAANQGSHTFSVTLKTSGLQSVTATDTASGMTGTATGIMVKALPAVRFRLGGLPGSSTAGTALDFTLTAIDPYGNADPTYTGTVHFASSDGTATLPADYTFSAADHGVHSFSATLRTAGRIALTASDLGVSTITGTQTLTVNPAAVASLRLDNLLPSTPPGSSQTFAVVALDSAGNVASGYRGTIHFSSTDPQANLPDDYTFTGNDEGRHTFQVTLNSVGAQSLSVTDTIEGSLTATRAITVNALTPLTAEEQNWLLQVLQALDRVGDTVSGLSALGSSLPGVGQSFNHLFVPTGQGTTIGDLIKLHDAARAYFQGTNAPTTGGLIQALLDRGLALVSGSATAGAATGPVDIEGGFDASHQQLRFDVGIHLQLTRGFTLELGGRAADLGLRMTVPPDLDMDLGLDLDFSFGLNIGDGSPGAPLTAYDAFFQVSRLQAHAGLHATDLNFGLNIGFLGARVDGGSAELDAGAQVVLTDPGHDGDNTITLAAIGDGSPGDLVTFSSSGTLRVVLPVVAQLGSAFITPTDPALRSTVTITDDDLFHKAPDIETANFGNLLDFGNVGPTQVLSILTQLGTYLEQFRDWSLLSVKIPFTTDKTLADVLDVATSFSQQLLDKLQTAGAQGGDPTFATAQALADQLASILGLPPDVIHVQYDPTKNELSFHVKLTPGFNLSTPLALDANQGPVAGITTSADVSLSGHATLEFTFGVDLSSAPVLTPQDANLPADGLLSGDVHFQVQVDGNTPVAVTIPLAVTLTGLPEWVAEGPSPILNGQAEGLTDNPVDGAISRIVVVPGDPDSVYVGAVNGGIWHTANAMTSAPTWMPLLDAYPSLSIGALALSPLDATGSTLFAGIGRLSNGFADGGPQNGVLETTDGGQHWTLTGQATFQGLDIDALVPTSVTTLTGQLILVGTTQGAFLSTDGGRIYNAMTIDTSLPVGTPPPPVTDLIADPDPAHKDRFFAALAGRGVFRGLYDSGTNSVKWTAANGTSTGLAGSITGLAGSVNIKLAAHDYDATNDILYAAVVNSAGDLSGVFRSADQGSKWILMDLPGTMENVGGTPTFFGVNPGHQGNTNLSLAADPTSPDVVFIAGDRQPGGGKPEPNFPNASGANTYSARIFRGDASRGHGSQWDAVTANGANGTAPHADSRVLVFADRTHLLEADDAGIYRLNSPNDSGRRWEAIDHNLQVTEVYSVAYDPLNHVLVGGAQDVGSEEQSPPDWTSWNEVQDGDGTTVAVAVDGATTVRFDMTSSDLSTLEHRTFDATNTQVGSTTTVLLALPGSPTADSALDKVDASALFDSVVKYAVNAVTPSRLLVGRHGLYEGTPNAAGSYDYGDHVQPLTIPGQITSTRVTALAYGGAGNADAIYVGVNQGLYVRTKGGGALVVLAGYPGAGAQDVSGITLDPTDWKTAYLTDGIDVFKLSLQVDATGTVTGQTWTRITGNLGQIDGQRPPGTSDPDLRSVAFLRSGGKEVILVGGRTGLYKTTDAAAANPVWTRVSGMLQGDGSQDGGFLPHVPVNDVHYDATNDFLYVATAGRGVWGMSHAAAALAATPTVNITQDGTADLRVDPYNPLLLDIFLNQGLVTDATTTPDYTFELAALQKINVTGRGGDDTLIIDTTNGAITPAITFTGGAGADNHLVFAGPPPSGGLPVVPVSGAGSVTVNGTTVTFTNLKGIDGPGFTPATAANPTAAVHSLQDLVDAINTELDQLPGLESVRAELRDSKIVLTKALTNTVGSLMISVNASDPAATQLGFTDGQSAYDAQLSLFAQDVSATGTATLAVNNLTASAHIGPVGIHVGQGSASGTATLGLSVQGPGGSSKFDVFKDLGHLTVTPTLTGSAVLDLQHIGVDAGLFSTPADANPSVHVELPDFIHHPEDVKVTTSDMDQLLPFQDLSFSTIVDALDRAAHTLSNYPQLGFLNSKLPLINKSVTDLLDFAGPLAHAVDQLGVNGLLNAIKGEILQLLNLPPDSNAVQLSYDSAGKALKIDVTLDTQFDQALGLNLDLATLTDLVADPQVKAFLQKVAQIADVSGQATVAVTAGAILNLDVGINLDAGDSANYLHPFLYDDTGVSLNAMVRGSDLAFTADVAGLGIFIKGGSAVINKDGALATTDPAKFALGVTNAINHRHYLDADLLHDLTVTLTGGVGVDLPVYFPVETMPAGDLKISIPDLAALFKGTPGSVVMTTPDFAGLLNRFASLDTLLTQPGVLVQGFDGLLASLQHGLDRLGTNLPLVGNQLAGAAGFIGTFRQDVVAPLDAAVKGLNPVNAVQHALFDVFGPGHLNLLADAAGNKPQPGSDNSADDIINQYVPAVLERDGAGQVVGLQFGAHLHDSFVVSIPLATDIGVPGLALKVDGNPQLQVRLTWDLNVGLGFSQQDGLYLDNSADHLLAVHLDVTLPQGLDATGHLGFLEVNVTDTSTAPTEGLHGYFYVNLVDPDANPRKRLTLATLLSNRFDFNNDVQAHMGAAADVHLHLQVSYQSAAQFPSIQTEFHLIWAFSPTDPDLSGGEPTIEFNDVRLDLGSFITNFAQPFLAKINNAIAPLQPVVDILDKPLDLLSQLEGKPTNLLDMLNQKGLIKSDVYNGVMSFIDAYNIVHQLASAAVSGASLQIHFGSFRLGAPDPSDPTALTFSDGSYDARSPGDPSEVVPDGLPAVDLSGQLAGAGGSVPVNDQQFVSDLNNDQAGFSFPILSKPSTLFQLLMGKDVDLVKFSSPVLTLGFSMHYDFPLPILPVLVATVAGSLNASFHLQVGYDTAGLRELVSDPNHDWTDALDGFYIYTDRNAPVDQTTVVSLKGTLGIGGGLNVGLASGGVMGQLAATISVTPADPHGDHKLRWKDIRDDIAANQALAIFEISGQVTASLFAWYDVFGISHDEFNLFPPMILLNFDVGPGGNTGPTAGTPPTVTRSHIPGTDVSIDAPNLHNVQAVANPDPGGSVPPGVNFPFGFVTFQQTDLLPGASSTVVVTLPPETYDLGEVPPPPALSYYKFGPTPDNPTPHWYNFSFDPATNTGAEIHTNDVKQFTIEQGPQHIRDYYMLRITRIVLHFVDGQRGDDDLAANGVIVDPGALAMIDTGHQGYVARLYRDLLHREAESRGLAYWSSLVDRRRESRFQVAWGIVTSPEARSVQVQAVYGRTLGRAAKPRELSDAVGFLRRGGTIEQLEAGLIGSQEYFRTRTGGTRAGFAAALVHDVLGQPIAPHHEAAIVRLLASGMTRTEAARSLLRSHRAKVVQAVDFYREFLHRQPDHSDLKSLAKALVRGVREDVIVARLEVSLEGRSTSPGQPGNRRRLRPEPSDHK